MPIQSLWPLRSVGPNTTHPNARENHLSANENPGCLGGLFRLFGGAASVSSADGVEELPYRLRDDFLSQAEASFFRVLKSTVSDKAVVLAKVNLADIFFVARPNENKGARGRISQKHVDFLLIDSQTLRPIVAIELDDSSHQRADRQARDELVDSVFKAAGLALLHIPVRQAYSVVELSSQLEPLIGGEMPSLQAPGLRPWRLRRTMLWGRLCAASAGQ